MRRDWPQNLRTAGQGILHLVGQDIPVRARHVSDPAEARAGAKWIKQKYAASVQSSADGEPLTPAEQATFELTPESGESAASTS